MKNLNKVALLFATAVLATAAGAQTRVTAADGGNRIDNWSNGSGELTWKSGNGLCWRNANWTPATAAKDCDGALAPRAPAAAPAKPAKAAAKSAEKAPTPAAAPVAAAPNPPAAPVTAAAPRPAPATPIRPMPTLDTPRPAVKADPKLANALQAAQVEMRADATALTHLGSQAKTATEEDWSTEYLDAIISAKVVDGLDAAMDHIERYGSHHTDAIITADQKAADKFLNEVDSAIVLHNATTQFADGGEFGFGAEIGISTDKFHARGPVGIEGLTSLKYVVLGEGEVRH